nr:unnamed protein product [Callosobruchus analis]
MAAEQQDTAAVAASYDDSKIESDGTVLNELELTQVQLKTDCMPHLFDEFAKVQCQIECLSNKVEQFEEKVEFENAHYLSVARIKSFGFVKLNINERIGKAKQIRLCLNCLKPGHFSRICRASTCKKCNYKHYVLLHIEKPRHQTMRFRTARMKREFISQFQIPVNAHEVLWRCPRTVRGTTDCSPPLNNEIEQQLTRFWEIEELSHSNPLSFEEKLCEQNFRATTVRNDEGRFIVSIPFKDDIEKLGSYREHAGKKIF